jgi:hypothetical protein
MSELVSNVKRASAHRIKNLEGGRYYENSDDSREQGVCRHSY